MHAIKMSNILICIQVKFVVYTLDFCGFFFLEAPRFRFLKPENYTSVYHQEGTDVLFVGGQEVIYKLIFSDKGVHDTQVGGDTVTQSQSSTDLSPDLDSWYSNKNSAVIYRTEAYITKSLK